MQESPEVILSEAGGVAINGPLTLTTVADLLARHPDIGGGRSQADSQTDSNTAVTVDLGAVSHVDSAGLALLVEWDSTARRQGAKLRFVSAPEGLQSLARVAGVGDRFT